MIDKPYLSNSPAQRIALIHLEILRELRAALTAQNIEPTGPWFTHHLKMDPIGFNFDICIPIASEITAAGRVTPGELRAATVARTVYRGPYEGLFAAWSEFGTWISANGHVPAADLWEIYLLGPESSPDPAKWQTELNRPLAASA